MVSNTTKKNMRNPNKAIEQYGDIQWSMKGQGSL